MAIVGGERQYGALGVGVGGVPGGGAAGAGRVGLHPGFAFSGQVVVVQGLQAFWAVADETQRRGRDGLRIGVADDKGFPGGVCAHARMGTALLG
ncbi:hypothetical protein D9M69_575010 [compost metagenome]